jgi:NADPH-dependent curcumin reductase CurA
MRGAHVVGIAGSPEKCRFAVETLGYDECVCHRDIDFPARLQAACPGGVDVYFDNTGGAVTATVYGLLRQDARIALCGLVAEYGDPAARGPNMKHLLARQASVRAFSVRRNLHRMDEYRRQAAAWIAEGTLKYREEVFQGIERAPHAFRSLLAGRTLGKCLVQTGPDPTGS